MVPERQAVAVASRRAGLHARARRSRPRARSAAKRIGSGREPDRPERAWNAKPEWKTRSTFKPRGDKPAWKPKDDAAGKPAWVPKSRSIPKSEEEPASSWDEEPSSAEPADFAPPAEKPTRRAATDKPEWKPKGSFTPAARRDDDKPSFAKATEGKPAWKSKSRDEKPRPRGAKVKTVPPARPVARKPPNGSPRAPSSRKKPATATAGARSPVGSPRAKARLDAEGRQARMEVQER